MGFRSALVESPAKLNLALNQLHLSGPFGEQQIPVEDLTALVIDNHQSTITGALLAKLGQEGCAVVVCDDKHLPCGLFLPFHQYFQQAKVATDQAEMGQALKKRLWQALVRQKVLNQAQVLKLHSCNGHQDLKELSNKINSGDTGNIEARAAQIYFQKLFGPAFFRQGHYDNEVSRLNGALNYGYAVLRSMVAKALVARGFLPALGLKHGNKFNAFNLVDDFIEPFRPIADHLALKLSQHWPPAEKHLSREDRAALLLAQHHKMFIAGEVLTAHQAVEKAASSLAKALSHKEAGLLDLPELSFAKEKKGGGE